MPAQFLYILQPRCGLSFVAGSYHIFMVGKQKECEEPVLFSRFLGTSWTYLALGYVTRKYDPDSVSISIGLQLQHERFTPLKGHLLLMWKDALILKMHMKEGLAEANTWVTGWFAEVDTIERMFYRGRYRLEDVLLRPVNKLQSVRSQV